VLDVEGFNAVQDQVEGELELGLVVTTGDARPGVHVQPRRLGSRALST